MRCPRKLYLVVSRKCQQALDIIEDGDVYVARAAAVAEAEERNAHYIADEDDWRVETFVKGD